MSLEWLSEPPPAVVRAQRSRKPRFRLVIFRDLKQAESTVDFATPLNPTSLPPERLRDLFT